MGRGQILNDMLPGSVLISLAPAFWHSAEQNPQQQLESPSFPWWKMFPFAEQEGQVWESCRKEVGEPKKAAEGTNLILFCYQVK